MHAAAAFGQLRERFDVAAFNFSRRRQFFKFFFHKKIVILASRIHYASIKRVERTKSKTNCGASFSAAPTSGEFVEDLLETALASARLSPADRGLCQELVYGVVRWQADARLAHRAQNHAGREQKPALQNLLRLGLYQIFWLDRIPPHAAVHETVELAKHTGFGPQAGFVNAVLRGYLREADETKKILADLKISQPALGWSHPEWLVERWQKRCGDEETRQLLEWNNTPPKTFARVNTLKTDAGKLLERWREENVEYDFMTPATGRARIWSSN